MFPFRLNIGIIGSGVAGMSAAIRLACLGHKVIVFEGSNSYGGKLGLLQSNGFTFDTGPSLFTLPHLLLDLQALHPSFSNIPFHFNQLEHSCKYFFANAEPFLAPAATQDFCEKAADHFQIPKKTLANYFKTSQEIYRITTPVFLEKSLHKWRTYLSKSGITGICNLHKINMFKTLNQYNLSLTNPNLIQLFNRYATYNGSNPYKTPATMSVIPHIEIGIGTYFPAGGMISIAHFLYEMCKKAGVVFHFNTPIKEITTMGKKAIALKESTGRMHHFDKIISNIDVKTTYSKLLNTSIPNRVKNAEPSSSAIIFYWGIKKSFANLYLHNILFSENYEAEFDHIFNQKTLYEDPTVYINITSKMDKNAAPENCENWFVMVNTPYNSGQDWEKIRIETKKNVISKIDKMLNTNIETEIVFESHLDPILIEQKTGSVNGSLYGISSNSRISAFLRQNNKCKDIKNLYFCGGSVHPGGGIPLAILSGKIVAEDIGMVN